MVCCCIHAVEVVGKSISVKMVLMTETHECAAKRLKVEVTMMVEEAMMGEERTMAEELDLSHLTMKEEEVAVVAVVMMMEAEGGMGMVEVVVKEAEVVLEEGNRKVMAENPHEQGLTH